MGFVSGAPPESYSPPEHRTRRKRKQKRRLKAVLLCGGLFLLAFTHGLLRHESGAATREGERGRQRRSRDNDAGVKWDVNEARGEVL